jgi:hypothetical protein
MMTKNYDPLAPGAEDRTVRYAIVHADFGYDLTAQRFASRRTAAFQASLYTEDFGGGVHRVYGVAVDEAAIEHCIHTPEEIARASRNRIAYQTAAWLTGDDDLPCHPADGSLCDFSVWRECVHCGQQGGQQ